MEIITRDENAVNNQSDVYVTTATKLSCFISERNNSHYSSLQNN